MKKIIKSGNLEARVDTSGAFLESLTLNGKEVVFEKRVIEKKELKKVRGGSHICYPYFGSNEELGFASHGFGRVVDWKIDSESESKVTLAYKSEYETFNNVISKLTYALEDGKLNTVLTVKNESEVAVNIRPAFHPYFKYDKLENVKLDGKKFEFTDEELANSIFYGTVSEFETGEYKLKFTNNKLSEYVIWTDYMDKYICVEPTYNYGLMINDEVFVVESGATEVFSFSIDITE